jgi:hypothetical protein
VSSNMMIPLSSLCNNTMKMCTYKRSLRLLQSSKLYLCPMTKISSSITVIRWARASRMKRTNECIKKYMNVSICLYIRLNTDYPCLYYILAPSVRPTLPHKDLNYRYLSELRVTTTHRFIYRQVVHSNPESISLHFDIEKLGITLHHLSRCTSSPQCYCLQALLKHIASAI